MKPGNKNDLIRKESVIYLLSVFTTSKGDQAKWMKRMKHFMINYIINLHIEAFIRDTDSPTVALWWAPKVLQVCHQIISKTVGFLFCLSFYFPPAKQMRNTDFCCYWLVKKKRLENLKSWILGSRIFHTISK